MEMVVEDSIYKMAEYLSPSMQFVDNIVYCTILLKKYIHKTWTNTCLQNALHSPATVCFFDGLDYNPEIYSIIPFKWILY
jgi:hypothetical protein